MLVNRADSRQSTARFVGHGLEDSILCRRKTSRHNKRFFSFQASQTPNIKKQSHHVNLRAKNDHQKPKPFAQNENHKVKNFAYLAGKPRLPKNDGLQNDLAKTPAEKSRKNVCKAFRQNKHQQANELCQKTHCRAKLNFAKEQNQPPKKLARLTAGKPRQPTNETRAITKKSKRPLQKDSCRQTEINLKNEKPETENAGKRQMPARIFF